MQIITSNYLPLHLDGLALRWFIIIRKGHDSIIPHEMVHIKQQKHFGFFKYMFKYLTDMEFRVQMEFEAYYEGSKMSLIDAKIKASRYRNILKL